MRMGGGVMAELLEIGYNVRLDSISMNRGLPKHFFSGMPHVASMQGSFSAGTPGNDVPKVILTVQTAFKPALGELYSTRNTQFATKFAYLRSKIDFFLERGHNPFPKPSVGGRTPSPHPPTLSSLGAFDASIL